MSDTSTKTLSNVSRPFAILLALNDYKCNYPYDIFLKWWNVPHKIFRFLGGLVKGDFHWNFFWKFLYSAI